MINLNQVNKILLVSILFLSFASRSFAADVSFVIPPNINVGDVFEVSIKANTDGQSINSLDMAFSFPSELASFSGYKSDSSVVRMWISPPMEREGTIYFSGIIPGGVSGQYDANKQGLGAIPLTRLLFVAKKSGTGKFTFTKTEILQNDGLGSPFAFENKDGELTINIKNNISNINPDKPSNEGDQTPPEPFEIIFLEESIFSKTPSMIIFQANDVGSGIKQYQIKTGVSEWRDTKSPQPISKAIFPRNITVRATDFYGNFRDENIKISGLLPSELLWIIIVLLASGLWAYKLVKYKS